MKQRTTHAKKSVTREKRAGSKKVANQVSEERKTILCVEDDPHLLIAIAETLRSYHTDWDIITAQNGQAALELIQQNQPDLIMTDIMMPVMDGYAFLRAVRQMLGWQDIPFIFLTARSSVADMILSFEVGADDYITKPTTSEELVERIEASLNAPRTRIPRAVNELISALNSENARLHEQLAQQKKDTSFSSDIKHIRLLCGAVAHSLRGEFMHIGQVINGVAYSGSQLSNEDYEILHRSVQYSQIILQRLLDYLDIGKPTLEEVDLSDLLERTVSFIQPRLPSNIDLKVQIDPDLARQTVFVNSEQLMGVLLELIQNAKKALSQEGGIIDLHLHEKPQGIAITVTDNGPGIPSELIPKLLQEQVKSSSGLGLGLYLNSQIIDTLGGELTLEESSTKGTKFTILFPKLQDN